MADKFDIKIIFDDATEEEWTITADGEVDWGSEPKHIAVDDFVEMIKLHKLTSDWMNRLSARKIEIEKKPA